ncbi:Hypothetical protein OINT_2000257 [Brucella intermedia LMG 3301]|uniref:Uncharacterized protein n=1 Tax=Brucella intermedia LMG 3301 TaxID=641118 RepID=C4WMC5_9HYPH|nr:Hypothetical protein OINT_2000257 [Brucella intermedia LMG 3301]
MADRRELFGKTSGLNLRAILFTGFLTMVQIAYLFFSKL